MLLYIYTHTNTYMDTYIYIYTRLCNMGCISMLAAFCPEPPKHVGQPPVLPESSDESDEYGGMNPEDDQWQWEKGVVDKRAADPSFQLRRSM